MNNRVVIAGLGGVAPNGTGVKAFNEALKSGKSGVEFDETLANLNFQCQVSAKPSIDNDRLKEILPRGLFIKLENEAMKYACLAGYEAWEDSGLPFTPNDENPDWDTGVIFGVGALAMDEFIGDKFEILQSGNP